jgi:hypothetical protein
MGISNKISENFMDCSLRFTFPIDKAEQIHCFYNFIPYRQ